MIALQHSRESKIIEHISSGAQYDVERVAHDVFLQRVGMLGNLSVFKLRSDDRCLKFVLGKRIAAINLVTETLEI